MSSFSEMLAAVIDTHGSDADLLRERNRSGLGYDFSSVSVVGLLFLFHVVPSLAELKAVL